MPSQELAALREMIRSVDLGAGTLEERRTQMESVAAPPPEGTNVTAVDAAGVPAEWVSTSGARSDAAILYLHGGGYYMGSPNTSRSLAGHLAAATGMRVLSVDYRLAPEHRFPAALDDALAAYRWLRSQGERTVIAGDSAGGGLALGTLLTLRDAGDPLPSAAVVMSPWTDLALTGESITTRADADLMVSLELLKQAADWYLAGHDSRDPGASPLYGDLSGLPPLLIHVGDAEVLLDDSVRFASAAQAAGVNVTVEVWDEMPHVWHGFAGALPEADQAIARVGAWLEVQAGGGR